MNSRERTGWVLGVTPAQAAVCVVLAAPVLLALSVGNLSRALTSLMLSGPLAVLVVVPVRGRPALRWLGDLLQFQAGVLTGWSVWQSRAAAGDPGPATDPDLPGVLARLRFPDGPVFSDRGSRVCLIHDTVEARWGATAQLTHRGTGMLSAAECDQLAARLGSLLAGVGQRDTVDRISLYVRTVPDDGAEYQLWRDRHARPDAPELARRATAELDATLGAVSLRTEVFVCVSGREDVLRRPAEAAGGGVTGRALVLYRALDGLEDGLKPLGVQKVTWLTSARMAVALRTGYNPATAASLAVERLRGGSGPGLPLAAAGPTLAPTPAARAFHHDGFSTVSWAVLMPENGVGFGALGPLLAVRTAGERRTLAIHYEVMSARASARAVQRQRYRANIVRDVKASRGFSATATDHRTSTSARDQEYAVAAGAAMVRFAVAASVTVPSSWPVEDHAARLENDAAGRFRVLRLELAQDSAFVAAALPVGIGLPRHRGALP